MYPPFNSFIKRRIQDTLLDTLLLNVEPLKKCELNEDGLAVVVTSVTKCSPL